VELTNPGHDFPQVISYRRVASDSLVARIEGPGPQGMRNGMANGTSRMGEV